MIRSTQRTSSDRRCLKVLSTLNEFQARLYVADKAMDRGRGGVSYLSKLTGMSRTTITQPVPELEKRRKMVIPAEGRVRQPGGGRKRAEAIEPEIRPPLNSMVEETPAGDPMSRLRGTNKSTRRIAEELTRRGHAIFLPDGGTVSAAEGLCAASEAQDPRRSPAPESGCPVS